MTGIVLAGGKSSRMGQNKALLTLRGQRLIEMAIAALPKTCSEIIISANTDEYDFLNKKIVADRVLNIGALGGLHACMHSSDAECFCVISTDTPFVSQEVFELLIEQKENADVVFPVFKDRWQPLVALYHKSALSYIDQAIENKNYKLKRLILEMNFKPIVIDQHLDLFHENLFRNINTLEDYKIAKLI